MTSDSINLSASLLSIFTPCMYILTTSLPHKEEKLIESYNHFICHILNLSHIFYLFNFFMKKNESRNYLKSANLWFSGSRIISRDLINLLTNQIMLSEWSKIKLKGWASTLELDFWKLAKIQIPSFRTILVLPTFWDFTAFIL